MGHSRSCSVGFAFSAIFLVGCSAMVGTSSEKSEGPGGDPAGDPGGGVEVRPGPSDAPFGFTCSDSAPGEVRMRRLTKTQYENSIKDLITSSLADEAASKPAFDQVGAALKAVPDESRALSPRNPKHGSFRRVSQDLQQEHVDGYYAVGKAVGTALTTSANMPKLLGPCAAQGDAGKCIDSFIDKFGQRALRRPLAAAEKAAFKGVYGSANAIDAAALTDVITVILNNPAFVFQVEHGAKSVGSDATYALTPFELASRLSYHFWQTMPDKALYEAAASGDLATDRGYTLQVDRLFNDPRTHATMDSFIGDWFRLDEVNVIDLEKAGAREKKFIGSTPLTASSKQNMRTEILELTRHLVFEENATMRDLLTTDLSFAKTDDLRSIYGVSGAPPQRFESAKRPGLFTRAAFLTNSSVRTRPVMKGVFLRTEILCEELPSPPDNAADEVPKGDPNQMTTRDQIASLTEAKGSPCAGCHVSIINPLGYATENFDSLGRERSEERLFNESGAQVGTKAVDTRSKTALDGEDEREISGAKDLMAGIADSGKAEACLAKQYFRFAFSRWEDESSDGCTLEALRLAAADGPVKDMLKRVALADAFKQRTFE